MVKNRTAQSILEYAIIIAVITAGLIAMQVYLKRGLQGAWRSQSESIGEQYRPGQTVSLQEKETTINTTETSELGLGKIEIEEVTKQKSEQKVSR
jgi:Flp pilus assembly pilin Flp